MTRYRLTSDGFEKYSVFLAHARDKRKSALMANPDDGDDVSLPTIRDVLCDIETFEDADSKGNDGRTYVNYWKVTEDEDTDTPLMLVYGVDYIENIK